MKKTCISKDWKFKNLSLRTGYEDVDLPHDYQIKQKRDPAGNVSNGFYPDTVGKYVKHLCFAKNKRYILDIDGAFMCTRIEMNQQMLALHPYGYTPFLVDLTDSILEDRTNKLVITTAPLSRATRWYSGNGIYRDVFLWEGGDIRIEPWDMFISTSEATEAEAAVRLRYTVSSEEDAVVDVVFSVCGPDGTAVKTERLSQRVSKGKNEAEYILRIPSPKLWSIDTPSLYTLKTEIVKDGERLDVSENTFGIKTVAADAKNGLLINGKQVKLRGGCIHHDHGELGAAAFPAAEERKIRLLKEAGFNAVRCAHNPPSIALLECCDRIGMAVMDEAFDAWNIPKGMYDYNLFFEDWWARDISYMVKRDRNHPCVFSYSIGNEILEINGTSRSAEWAEKLSNEIRKYDDTKLVTSGIQKDFVNANWALESIDPEDYKEYLHDHFLDLDWEGVNKVTLPYEKSLDIVGVNYYFQNYLFEHEQYPHRVIWGSETHAISFYRSWELTKANSFILGDFTWTAYDNMGEVGAGRFDWYRDGYHRTLTLASYPWRNCYQGDLDLCGFRRPQSYFREAVWLGNTPPRIFTTHPEHFGEPFSGTWWHWYDVDET